MRTRNRRLEKLRDAIAEKPLAPGVMDEWYPWFTDFGELPDEDHIARAVVDRALRGGAHDPLPEDAAFDEFSVRSRLFDEALHDPLPLRRVARAAISLEVAHGGDVESPGFASRYGMPMHGSTAMHMLGYPNRWVHEPYEHQGHRLLARFDVLRARINSDNPLWFKQQGELHLTFLKTGDLPSDELRRETLLATLELDQLIKSKKGADVAELMALFDRAARTEGVERRKVLAAIGEAAKAGRLG